MATQTITEVLDDIDQTPEATNHTFSIDGVTYEIDLGEKNSAKLVKALAPFVAVAREVVPPAPVKKATGKNSEASQMRAWAVKQGLTVPARGRISKEVADAFHASQSVSA